MPAIYALICGALIYIAILAAFGRRMLCNRWSLAFGSLCLALAFAMLALSTAGVVQHGTHRTLTRIGFGGYALSLLVIIVQYWRAAWHARPRR